MDPVVEQMAERRARILEAARNIVGRSGVEGLTMRELAKRSRVTVPTIYNLIGGKDAVLFAAVEDQIERFVDAVEGSAGGGPVEGVTGVVDACAREMLRLPSYYRTLFLHFFTAPGPNSSRVEVAGALRTQLERAVRDVEASGALLPWVAPDVLADRMCAHLSFTALQWASGELSNEGLKAAARYDACTALAAATKDATRAAFERAAAAAQPSATSRGRRPGRRSKSRR